MQTEKRFKTSIILHGQKIIPSDTFEGEKAEYILMDIFKGNEEEGDELIIMPLSGSFLSQKFRIMSKHFEKLSLDDFERWIEEEGQENRVE